MAQTAGGEPCTDVSTANSIWYQGSRRTQGSATYTFGARTYNPSTATWLTPDRGAANGAPTDLGVGTDPLTANRYSYVNGDPINLSDPSGHDPRRAGFCEANGITPEACRHLVEKANADDRTLQIERELDHESLCILSQCVSIAGGSIVVWERGIPELDTYIAEVYRFNQQIPNGPAGALEWEIDNFARFKTDAGHYQKVVRSIRQLQRILRRGMESDFNREFIREELDRLRAAREYAEAAARERGASSVDELLRRYDPVQDVDDLPSNQTPRRRPSGPRLPEDPDEPWIPLIGDAFIDPLVLIPFPTDLFGCLLNPNACSSDDDRVA